MSETWSVYLHVLVFAHWLGGDAGAFMASLMLTDPRQSPSARFAAARILNQVDMAPRSALILTLPTGLTLAVQRGWLVLPVETIFTVWMVSLLWLVGLWAQHARQRPSPAWRIADLAARILLCVTCLFAAWLAPALFLKLKLLCLSMATVLGLAIRIAIAPMTPAVAELARSATSAETDVTIARALGIARPLVVCIWICLLVAAWAGIAKPG